jgi:predicted RNase H-like nuclease (RuvC/YqgF family)
MRARTQGSPNSKRYACLMLFSTSINLGSMIQDAKTLERTIREVQEILPALREEYEAVTRENEKEAQEVAEIEQCDQEYLMELKTSIAEQRYLSVILTPNLRGYRSLLVQNWTYSALKL